VTARRRRGLLLISVALASGGVAASEVRERERAVDEQVGKPVQVLVAERDIRAGARIGHEALALRRVPARFVPPDALPSAVGVVGIRAAARIVAGAYVTPSVLRRSNVRRTGNGLRPGQRAVTVEVAGAPPASAPGTRVDVLVSSEPGADGGRTVVALAGAELIGLAPHPTAYREPDPAAAPAVPSALATLRVTLRQAVYLTEADNFAREIRLLARPAGES
jgi:Flp pilus assembly protein CpaB